jgi:hypothetical protein
MVMVPALYTANTLLSIILCYFTINWNNSIQLNRIWSVFRCHNQVYGIFFNMNNTTGGISGIGTAYPSGTALGFTLDFYLSSCCSVFKFSVKCFMVHWLCLRLFSFGHCIIYLYSIYGFLISFWYLQTFLINIVTFIWETFSLFVFKCLGFIILKYIFCSLITVLSAFQFDKISQINFHFDTCC